MKGAKRTAILIGLASTVLLIGASAVYSMNSQLPTITIQSGVPITPSIPSHVSFDVSNPQGNSPLTGLIVTVPAGWTMWDCYAGSHLDTFTLSSSSCKYAFDSGGSPLAAGQSDLLGVSVIAPTASGSYPYSGTVQTMVNDSTSTSFYSGPSFPVVVMDPTTSLTISITPGDGNTQTTYTAGSAPYSITATASCTMSSSCPSGTEAGLNVTWSASYTPSGATYTFTPKSGITDSSGQAKTTFQPSNNPGDSGSVRASVETSGLKSSPSSAIVTSAAITTTTTTSVSTTSTTTSSTTQSSSTTTTSSSTTLTTSSTSSSSSMASTTLSTTTTKSTTTSSSSVSSTSTLSHSSTSGTTSSSEGSSTSSATSQTVPNGGGQGPDYLLLAGIVVLIGLGMAAWYALRRREKPLPKGASVGSASRSHEITPSIHR